MSPALRLLLTGGVTPLGFTNTLPAGVTYTRTGAASAYTASGAITAFAANAPQLTDRGLLLEPTATNLLLRSQELDNAAYTKSNSTITADYAVAPDGTTTMDRVVESAATGLHIASQVYDFGLNSTRTIVAGSFFKADGTGRNGYVRINDNVTGPVIYWINLSTGVATLDSATGGWSAYSAEVTPMAGGVYLLSIMGTAASFQVLSVGAGTYNGAISYAGDITKGVSVWGSDLKASSARTSYIPTTTATVTRGTPTVTMLVPPGRTRWRSVHFDGSTASGAGLTPGATFDIYAAISGAGKGGLGKELTRLEFLP